MVRCRGIEVFEAISDGERMSDFLLSGPELGRLLSVTSRTVLRLHVAGVLPREGRRYDPFACVPKYVEYVRNNAEASHTLAEEKKRLIVAQRVGVERKNAAADRQSIDRTHVEQTLERVGALIGSQLDGIGGRLAGELAAMTDPAAIRKVVFDECRRIRNTAAAELETLAGPAPHGGGAAGAAGEVA